MNELKKQVNNALADLNELWKEAIEQAKKDKIENIDLAHVITEYSKINNKVDAAFHDAQLRIGQTKKKGFF